MNKDLVFTANTVPNTVAVGNAVPIGSIIRRYGCIGANSTEVTIKENGYYSVTANATFTAAATGDVTLSLYQNGSPIPGASGTITVGTATTESNTISLSAIVRKMCCMDSSITVVASGNAPTINSFTLEVVKI